jgi:hypothetical protein
MVNPVRRRIDVLLRTCSRVDSVHGSPRIVDATKDELIASCAASLIRSVERARQAMPELEIAITVVDDHSDPACVDRLKALLTRSAVQWEWLPMLERTGNGASLLTSYERARSSCPDLIYFVEDDYLHFPEAILEMVEFFTATSVKLGRDIAVFPCDYADRYRDPYPSYITLGSARYWRSVAHVTGTLMLSRATLEAHWERFVAFGRYGLDPAVTEDSTINRIFSEVPCFSPMPSLTVHMQGPELMPPFVDWRSAWEEASAQAR